MTLAVVQAVSKDPKTACTCRGFFRQLVHRVTTRIVLPAHRPNCSLSVKQPREAGTVLHNTLTATDTHRHVSGHAGRHARAHTHTHTYVRAHTHAHARTHTHYNSLYTHTHTYTLAEFNTDARTHTHTLTLDSEKKTQKRVKNNSHEKS